MRRWLGIMVLLGLFVVGLAWQFAGADEGSDVQAPSEERVETR